VSAPRDEAARGGGSRARWGVGRRRVALGVLVLGLGGCEALEARLAPPPIPIPEPEALRVSALKAVFRFGRTCPADALAARHSGFRCDGGDVVFAHCADYPASGSRRPQTPNVVAFVRRCDADGACAWREFGTRRPSVDEPGCVALTR
jgi:hypothetical protein